MTTYNQYYETSQRLISELEQKMQTEVHNPKEENGILKSLNLTVINIFQNINSANESVKRTLSKAIEVGEEAIKNKDDAVTLTNELSKDNLKRLSELLHKTKKTIDKSEFLKKILNYSKEDSPPQPAPETLVEDEKYNVEEGGYKKRKSNRKHPSKRIRARTRKHKWSLKYKKSINCNEPRGFSQRQYCKYGRASKQHSQTKFNQSGGDILNYLPSDVSMTLRQVGDSLTTTADALKGFAPGPSPLPFNDHKLQKTEVAFSERIPDIKNYYKNAMNLIPAL